MKPILPPKYRTVVLYRDRLLYDINFESWKIAKVRVNDKALQAETSTDEEADMWIERQIDTCLGEVKGSLQFCLDHLTKAGDIANDKLKMRQDTDVELEQEQEEEVVAVQEDQTQEEAPAEEFPVHYTIGFRFSPYWNGNIESIKTAIHSYICSFTLAKWFELVKPDESVTYAKQADSWLGKAINFCRQEDCSGITFRL